MTTSVSALNVFNAQRNKNTLNKSKKIMYYIAASMVLLLLVAIFGGDAFAWTAPVAGAPGYAFYDTVVTKGIQGPIGQTAGIFFMARGASELSNSPYKAGGQIAAGGVLFQSETIAQSFGYSLDLLSVVAG
jgi:hypothetical protein